MLKDRQRIERQLARAQQAVTVVEKQLEEKGVTGTQLKRQPKWRHVKADFRQLRRRLLAVTAIEQREAAAIQRKADKLNGVSEDSSADE